ncbi:hypothetical protein MASR1M32_01620 [Rhodobacter sp.]
MARTIGKGHADCHWAHPGHCRPGIAEPGPEQSQAPGRASFSFADLLSLPHLGGGPDRDRPVLLRQGRAWPKGRSGFVPLQGGHVKPKALPMGSAPAEKALWRDGQTLYHGPGAGPKGL